MLEERKSYLDEEQVHDIYKTVDEFVSRLGTIHEWFNSEDVRKNVTQVRNYKNKKGVLMITFIVCICSLTIVQTKLFCCCRCFIIRL